MKTISFLLMFLGVVVMAALPARAQYLHPKVSAREVSIRKVVVLPARVEIVRVSVKGPEGMAAESELLSARVTKLVIEALRAKQISVSTNQPVTASDTDPEKKYLLSDFQSRYDALLPKIVKKPKDVKNARFSLGDEVLNLNLDKDTDAIIFVRGEGQKLTGGKAAFSILTLSLNRSYLMLKIGVIDARTGDVLVYADALAFADATKDDDNPLRKALEKSLKKLPPAP
jgi:hypothetical protein